MYLILNKYAAAGRATKNWEKVKSIIYTMFDEINVVDIDKDNLMDNSIKEAIKNDEKDFIIAGGDGTINLFINRLIGTTDVKEIKNVRIGAIGIGSSNDFHKPLYNQNLIAEIFAKIKFNSSEPRDVGVIKYRTGSEFLHKYFLLNASIGVTAEANNLFNKPDSILKILKKYFTPLAILYAAVKTIFAFKNFKVQIVFNSYETYSFQISNLSIIKNPNFSGDLSYPGEANYQNGIYDIFLAHSMNKLDLINLLKSLSKKIFPKNEKIKYCTSSIIKITAENDFLIEFDGEIISTNYAEFTILNKYLNICTS